MYKNLYKSFDNISPSDTAVEKAVCLALNTDEKNNCKVHNFSKRKMTISVLAACLVLVFVCTFIFGLQKPPVSVDEAIGDYNFIIRANAYQAEKFNTDEDKAVIAAYSGILSGGWAMYQNFEKESEKSPNFFQSYAFNNFSIEGENIESVTFRSNAQGTYFAVSPAGFFVNAYDAEINRIENETLKLLSDMSLSNSQYTAEELCEYSDGLSFGRIYCDTFTFNNTEKTNIINLSNKLEFILESNHSDKVISEKLDKLWECEQKILELRSKNTSDSGMPSGEEDALYRELDELSVEIRQRILSDSTIDVVVKFSDGTQQTKKLIMGLEEADNNTFWLTISE